MTIIVFLVDTSASMNQKAYLGGRPTLLDIAKNAVETFVKIRQRNPDSRGDRYMLLTFEEPVANIKAGWKENLATFYLELKNLQANGMTTLGSALKNTFDVLNINRMQTGIDTYGQGRCPFYLEPSMIIVITDGGRLSNAVSVQDENPIPGSELTKEPFRWDQRLFSLVLRLTGMSVTPDKEASNFVPSDLSPIDAMCEVTGGRSYSITTHRMLMQCIESLVLKVQSGVVLNFEKTGPDPPPVTPTIELPQRPEEFHPNDCLEVPDFKNTKDYMLNTSGDTVDNGSSGDVLNKTISSTSPIAKIDSLLSNNTTWQNCRRLIYVPRTEQKGFPIGHWPIPEAFWPDLNSPTLPPRTAHPNLKFTCLPQKPLVLDKLPFDKYELEPSPLTQMILSRRQPSVCWHVFISNSYKTPEVSHPFGYLKAASNLQCVNLVVLPYNYPVLLPLLDELFRTHRVKPTKEWRAQFDAYLRNMPAYYAGSLRRALQLMGAPNLVPDVLDTGLSFSVLTYLKRLKGQAKLEYERICSEVARGAGKLNTSPDGAKILPHLPLPKDLTCHPCLKRKFSHYRDQLNEFNGFLVGLQQPKGVPTESLRNPFDISRKYLLEQISRMRTNFLQSQPSLIKLQYDGKKFSSSAVLIFDIDMLHRLPVGQMGNYQEFLKCMTPPLREIEAVPVRQHMFGNPFKVDKRMMVDETDIDVQNNGSRTGVKRTFQDIPTRSPKRKPGPLPPDINVKRPTSGGQLLVSTFQSDIEMTPSQICDNQQRTTSLEWTSSCIPLISECGSQEVPSVEHNHVLTSVVNPQVVNHNGEISFLPSDSLKDWRSFWKENLVLRRSAFKHIRKSGKNYQPVLDLLQNLKGSEKLKKVFIDDIIKEALRFKKRNLAALLQIQQNEIKTDSVTNS